MTYTRAIGWVFGKIIDRIVGALALSRIHPNVLTFLGLVINTWAAFLFAAGSFRWAGAVVILAAVFDMVDGRVARETNRVTRFGGFFDSVLDRYSDLALFMGLLVYYATINRFFYIVLTAIVMTGSVMVSYARARAEIKEFPRDHRFATTNGSDNIIAFTTTRYARTPLVVQGPGAGAEVTALGVLSDVVKLLNQLPH